jgi:hypothetical protein
LKLNRIVWLTEIVEKLAVKHGVGQHEVEELLNNNPKVRLVEKGSGRAKMFTWLREEPTPRGTY